MKSISRKYICILFVFQPLFLLCQITIKEMDKKIEEKIVIKPEPYDSLKNWETHENEKDYKMYIGLQVYLPPFVNQTDESMRIEIGNRTYNEYEIPILFTQTPTIINLDSLNKTMTLREYNLRGEIKKITIYKKAATLAYKPFILSSLKDYTTDSRVYLIVTNDISIGDKYYTIIDVIYGERRDSLYKRIRENLKSQDVSGQFQDNYVFSQSYKYNRVFVLKNDISGDTTYCVDLERFFLVPYFVKQKELFKNKKLVYDDLKTGSGDWSSFVNSDIVTFDTRYEIKKENDKGKDVTEGKEVVVVPGSKWYCSDVTLVKEKSTSRYESRTYNIRYILGNEKNEEIALESLKGFMTEVEYLKREANNKIQMEQLLIKQKQELQLRNENVRKATEKRKAECVNLYGQINGELIAQEKIKIGMTQEMCKYAWGNPYSSNKTTIKDRVTENWFYLMGYILYFENGILSRIEE